MKLKEEKTTQLARNLEKQLAVSFIKKLRK